MAITATLHIHHPATVKFMTRVVHWRKERYDIDIRRPAKWGNPFRIGVDGTRSEVIAKYRAWLLEQPQLLQDIEELRGKTLGCWCHPKPCHGDVLIEMLHQSSYDDLLEY